MRTQVGIKRLKRLQLINNLISIKELKIKEAVTVPDGNMA